MLLSAIVMALESTGVGSESVGGGGGGWQDRGGGVRRGGGGEAGQVLGGAEVTTSSPVVWGGEGYTAGGIGCDGWGIRWGYRTEPWEEERVGKLSVSHEKRKIFRRQKGNRLSFFLIVYQILGSRVRNPWRLEPCSSGEALALRRGMWFLEDCGCWRRGLARGPGR